MKLTSLFNPEYGINLERILFDLISDESALDLFNEIIDAVRKFEPRVKLNMSKSDVIPDPDNNKYDVVLYFTITGFENQTFTVTEEIKR